MSEHVDVLIVGAGISGIGCAYHLQDKQPDKSYAILEARDTIGGTWDLFRYPGIRSDSDLFTFGYRFKPWVAKESIADADSILDYLHETVRENGIDRNIRFGHKVMRAAWSSAESRWIVEAERDGERVELTANWLFAAGGYYSYDKGFTPDFEGLERFGGDVIHPQDWPEDLDYEGKRVLVIGSGATAVTLVPAMARTAAHVTMLQRTPTYILPVPAVDPIVTLLRRWLGPRRSHKVARGKNVLMQSLFYKGSRRYPDAVRKLIRAVNRRALPEGYDVDTHMNPPYNPWDQRVCIVPDGDLYKSIHRGDAEIVTDRVATFTETGVRLESGKEIEADIVVTATGLDLVAFGGVDVTIDGEPLVVSEHLAYKGMMLSGVPNFAYAIGYTNASWTLKVDLVCDHLCRLLAHMDEHGYVACTPELANPGMETRPLLDFEAGYVKRALHLFPKQGTGAPWELTMDYRRDRKLLREGPVDDEMRFTPAPSPEPAARRDPTPTPA